MSIQTITNKPSLIQHINDDPSSSKVIKAFIIATFIAFCFLLGVILMSNILQKQPLNGMTAVDEQYQINQTISPSGLEAVEYSLRNQFMASDWRLTGIEKTKHGIEVYVQIPTQLSVTDREFDHYVRHSVCPKQTDALWNEVRPSQLIIRLYTDVKSLASQTRCG